MRRAIRWQWGPARLLVLLVLAAVPTGAWCHALAPSLLDIEAAGSDAVGSDALGGSRYAVQWKTPQQRVPGSELQPRLPAHCATVEPARTALEGTGVVWRWVVDCGAGGLIGTTVSVQGIAGSRAACRYPVEAIRRFPDQAAFARLIEQAGFVDVGWRNLSFDIAAIHAGRKRSA